MAETLAGARFDPELAVEDLPKPVLVELRQRTAAAHGWLIHERCPAAPGAGR
jgi:hypothetical protein